MQVFEHPDTTGSWDKVYYDNPAALYYFDAAIAKAVEMVGANPGDTILDAGCGAGVHSVRMAKAGYRVDAIDISSAALDDARARADADGVADKITFRQEDLTQLSFPDGSYDRVISWGVIIHIPDAQAAIAELTRILAPGGRLLLYVTNEASFEEKVKRTLRPLTGRSQPDEDKSALGTSRWLKLNDEDLWLWRFNMDGLVKEVEQHGVKLVGRHAGEFTELHMFLSGLPRKALFHLNNYWFDGSRSPNSAHANILVFEKPA